MILARYQAFRRPPKWALDDKKINTDQAHRFGLKWAKGWVIPIWSPYPTGDFDDLLGWQFKRLDFVSNFPKTVKKSEALFGLRTAGQDDHLG